MSSSKRKVSAGGYQDSSDYEDDEERAYREIPLGQSTNKRPKSSSPVLPNLKLGSAFPRFSLAKSGSSIQQFSSRTTSTPEPISSSQATSSVGLGTPTPRFTTLSSRGNTLARGSEALGAVQLNTAATTSSGLHSHSTQSQSDNIRMRPTIAVERQLHTLATAVEENRKQGEEQYSAMTNTLDQILCTVQRLEAALHSAPSSGLPGSSALNVSSDQGPSNSNLDEMRDTAARVARDHRDRIGKKKGGPEENSHKEHMQNACYKTWEIGSTKEIRPYFEDEHGEPDTLPEFAVDLSTGYCTPHPHWKATFVKNFAWIPMVVARFKATIPNDNSELSRSLRGLTDEQILILLHDGPWKTCVQMWNNLKKSSAELNQMRSNARRARRVERRAAIRKSYYSGIPLLQGPAWEHLSHTGNTSADESDEEGRLITYRPIHRAKWLNNLNEAVDVAEGERIRDRLGPNARVPVRHVVLVDRPIPELVRGSGTKAVPLRVAVCSLSKAWRDNNPGELRRAAHLINHNITTKPSIDTFLSQHPLDHEQYPDSRTAEGQPNTLEDESAAPRNARNFQIDPQLLQGESQSQVQAVDSETQASDEDNPAANVSEAGTSVVSHGSGMPPPPVLDERPLTPVLDKPVPKKRGRPKKSTVVDTVEDTAVDTADPEWVMVLRERTSSQQLQAQEGGAAPAKKRGRPPGSKNRK